MRIVFLIKSEKTPSSRIRFIDLIPLLKIKGFSDIDIKIIPKNNIERKKLFCKMKKYDVVVLQKRLLGWLDFTILRKYSKYLIYDFDDAIYLKNASPSQNIKNYKSSTRKRLFARIVKKVDCVIAANSILKKKVLEFAPNTKTQIIPSTIDNENNIKNKMKLSNPIIIGWIGSASTLRYLYHIQECFYELKTKYDFELRIIADKSIELEHINIKFIPWNLETQYQEIKKIDIGIMPLSNDPFSEGKAAFKLLQYLSAGVPSICSPIGMNNDVSDNELNCLKANSAREFFYKISLLIENYKLRENLSKNGIELIKNKYSNKIAVEKWEKTFNNISYTVSG